MLKASGHAIQVLARQLLYSPSLHSIIFNERETIMIRKAIALACASMALMLAACNTMQGAGKDIERGGEKVQGAAERNK
jgi:entericidin B